MKNNYNELSETIKKHLEMVTESSGLADTEESLERITKNWLRKKEMFEEQIKSLDMIEVEAFNKDDEKGVLMLTYSGSLMSLGTLRDDVRWGQYSSIKLRADVPDIITSDDIKIANNTGIDKNLEFDEGPIKKTSSILKIVVCREDVSLDEQDMRIREATIFLTNGFMKINRNLSINDDANIGQFTMKSMVTYIAKSNNIPNAQAKKIVDDFLYILESGILLGERVPLGRLGKFSIKKRPPQKARVGRNPATGEEVTVKAKPEMFVPKLSFSKYMKDRSALVKIDSEYNIIIDESDDSFSEDA